MISILLFGFLTGNLFGTVLIFVRQFILWDGFIIVSCLIVLETISYISYKPRRYKHLQSSNLFHLDGGSARTRNTFTKEKSFTIQNEGFQQNGAFPPLPIKTMSFFKVGVMIGFFVDAFKVGS